MPFIAVRHVLYVRTHATIGRMDNLCNHPSRASPHNASILGFRRPQRIHHSTKHPRNSPNQISQVRIEPQTPHKQQLTNEIRSAQIKTHRFRAFSDIPIFIKRHCDLTAANAHTTPNEKLSHHNTGINNVNCSCSSLETFRRAASSEYMTPSDSSTTSSEIPPELSTINTYAPQYSQYPFASGFPYSTQQSAKICLQASLVISRMFTSLPIPQPLSDNHTHAQARGRPLLPRTMPSFACCLMQSSYAMLMIFYKARVAKQLSLDADGERGGDSTGQLIEELRQGLQRLVAAVSNYSLAFEAMDGMRGESYTSWFSMYFGLCC